MKVYNSLGIPSRLWLRNLETEIRGYKKTKGSRH